MAARQPRYSREEFARRGNEIYESQVRQQVEEENQSRVVAIGIETGAYELANIPMEAVDRLYEQRPDAQPWVIRIGHGAVFRFGSRSLGFAIVSKDSDFYQRSLLYGHPPKFIYLRIGNSPTSTIVRVLRDNFDTISEFETLESKSILVLA